MYISTRPRPSFSHAGLPLSLLRALHVAADTLRTGYDIQDFFLSNQHSNQSCAPPSIPGLSSTPPLHQPIDVSPVSVFVRISTVQPSMISHWSYMLISIVLLHISHDACSILALSGFPAVVSCKSFFQCVLAQEFCEEVTANAEVAVRFCQICNT